MDSRAGLAVPTPPCPDTSSVGAAPLGHCACSPCMWWSHRPVPSCRRVRPKERSPDLIARFQVVGRFVCRRRVGCTNTSETATVCICEGKGGFEVRLKFASGAGLAPQATGREPPNILPEATDPSIEPVRGPDVTDVRLSPTGPPRGIDEWSMSYSRPIRSLSLSIFCPSVKDFCLRTNSFVSSGQCCGASLLCLLRSK